jgi:hypothetical protein
MTNDCRRIAPIYVSDRFLRPTVAADERIDNVDNVYMANELFDYLC